MNFNLFHAQETKKFQWKFIEYYRGLSTPMEVFWYHIVIPDLGYSLQLAKKSKALLQSVTKNHLVHLQNLKNQLNLQILRQELLQGKGKLTHLGLPVPLTN